MKEKNLLCMGDELIMQKPTVVGMVLGKVEMTVKTGSLLRMSTSI